MSKMELIAGGTLVDRESGEKIILEEGDRLIDLRKNIDNGSTIVIGKGIEVYRNGVRDVVDSIKNYREAIKY